MQRRERDKVVRLLLLVMLFGALLLGSACTDEEEGTDYQGAYEIWALDQGTHLGYVYDDRFVEVAVIDFEAKGMTVPHMISFSSDYRYAVVANMGSGNVGVLRTADREVVAVLETGPHTHMASFTPDDSAILVDVIGHGDHVGEVVEIEVNLDEETFEMGRRLRLSEDPLLVDRLDEFPNTSPICHEYGAQGHAFITLGPALSAGGLVVLNLETFALERAFSPEELPVNCGTMPNSDRSQMVLTGGSATVGHFYVIDTETFEIVHDAPSGGLDAHGVWLSPDGSRFFLVNRVSDDGIVIDAETFEVLAEFDDLGGTPDILAMDPGGEYLFVSLRGPNPVSAPHVAVGETPGFSVLDASTLELLEVIQPARDNPDSDFHGIGVRVIRP